MRPLIVCAVLLLSSCGVDHAREAGERYRIVQGIGGQTEVCEAAKEVRDAYLKQRDETQYLYWSIRVGKDCSPY